MGFPWKELAASRQRLSTATVRFWLEGSGVIQTDASGLSARTRGRVAQDQPGGTSAPYGMEINRKSDKVTAEFNEQYECQTECLGGSERREERVSSSLGARGLYWTRV